MVNGKRVRRTYATRAQAEGAVELAEEEQRRHGDSALEVSHADRVRLSEWLKRCPEGTNIDDVFRFYLAHHSTLNPVGSVEGLVRTYATELEGLGRTPRYIRETSSLVLRFFQSTSVSFDTIGREELVEWIVSPGLSPASQVMRRTVLGSFFKWLVDGRYIVTNPLDKNRVRVRKERTGDILALGAAECRRLLGQAKTDRHRDLLGFLVAALFCGVRPDEVRRLELSRLCLKTGTLRVSAAAAKTAKSRVIPLHPTAAEWFSYWLASVPDPTFKPVNFRRRWECLRKDAHLLQGWVHDALRHTFASMDYALNQNASTLKAKLGHSQGEETLFAHYNACVTTTGATITRYAAEEFWSIRP